MKGNKPTYLLLSGVFILLIVILFLFMRKDLFQTRSTENKTAVVTQAPEVATDPHFLEVKGQLLPGFPQFSVYPGATLVASAKTAPEGQQNTGYRVKWKTNDYATKVMPWYQSELPKNGWKIVSPGDPNAGEQVAEISKDTFKGFLEIVTQGNGETDIEVEVRFR